MSASDSNDQWLRNASFQAPKDVVSTKSVDSEKKSRKSHNDRREREKSNTRKHYSKHESTRSLRKIEHSRYSRSPKRIGDRMKTGSRRKDEHVINYENYSVDRVSQKDNLVFQCLYGHDLPQYQYDQHNCIGLNSRWLVYRNSSHVYLRSNMPYFASNRYYMTQLGNRVKIRHLQVDNTLPEFLPLSDPLQKYDIETEDEYQKKLEELNRKTRERPEDTNAWYELVNLQDKIDYFSHSKRSSKTIAIQQKKIDILQRALAEQKNGSAELFLLLMKFAQELWEHSVVLKKYQTALKQYYDSDWAVWFSYLDFCQSHYSIHKYHSTLSIYDVILGKIQSSLESKRVSYLRGVPLLTTNAIERVYVQFIHRLCQYHRESGYDERALEIYSSFIEFMLKNNRQEIQQKFDSETEGEDKVLVIRHPAATPQYKKWLDYEKYKSDTQCIRYCGRKKELMEDDDRIVQFHNVENVLLVDISVHWYSVWSYFSFLGLGVGVDCDNQPESFVDLHDVLKLGWNSSKWSQYIEYILLIICEKFPDQHIFLALFVSFTYSRSGYDSAKDLIMTWISHRQYDIGLKILLAEYEAVYGNEQMTCQTYYNLLNSGTDTMKCVILYYACTHFDKYPELVSQNCLDVVECDADVNLLEEPVTFVSSLSSDLAQWLSKLGYSFFRALHASGYLEYQRLLHKTLEITKQSRILRLRCREMALTVIKLAPLLISPVEVRMFLEDCLHEFPCHSTFLVEYQMHESHFPFNSRFERYIYDTIDQIKDDDDLRNFYLCTFRLLIQSSGTQNAPALNRMRVFMDKILQSPVLSHMPLLWKLMIEAEITFGKKEKCLAMIPRAIERCPWVKLFFYQAFTYNNEMSENDVKLYFKIMKDKEIRMRTLLEEVEFIDHIYNTQK